LRAEPFDKLRTALVEARHGPFDKLIAQHYGGLPVRVQLTQDPERLGMTYTAAHLAPSPIRSQQ
jgi:hypothetical protein